MKKLLRFFGGFALLTSCSGEPTSPPDTPASAAPSLAATTATLPFAQVSAGGSHTCGVTTGSELYCWGYNGEGQLGIGSTDSKARPTLVAGGLLFRQVTAGLYHTCAVTTDFRAYCWGANYHGAVGDGTTIRNRLTPVAVAGGRAFRQISAGQTTSCALTTSPTNKIYCWGEGFPGNGSSGEFRTPQLVSGARTYRKVSVGMQHTCGLTTTKKVFCWGRNSYGQLGNGSDASFIALNPVKVAGLREYRELDAGGFHTCAVTVTDKAYCWGDGRKGQIGDGKNYLRFTPRAVAGRLSFGRVSAGYRHTCGETTGDKAYCWGENFYGQLGNGSTNRSFTPTPVQGGLLFKQVDAGQWHSCGVDSRSQAWCWGENSWGQLGNGTHDRYAFPSPVQF